METMRYTETKKSSKGIVIGLILFFIIGGVAIFYLLNNQKEPDFIGQDDSDIGRLVNMEKVNPDEQKIEAQNIEYNVTEKNYNDTSNKKIKSSIQLPYISINSTDLTELNSEIESKYLNMFETLKEQNKNADNNYTYIVSYNVYDNMIDTKKIISVTIYDRIRDDSSKKNTMDKITTYNIDSVTSEQVNQTEVALLMFGKDYKSKINEEVKKYVISNNMAKENEFTYTWTGLESFYIKDGKFHIVFNSGTIVDEKYNVLDITIE